MKKFNLLLLLVLCALSYKTLSQPTLEIGVRHATPPVSTLNDLRNRIMFSIRNLSSDVVDARIEAYVEGLSGDAAGITATARQNVPLHIPSPFNQTSNIAGLNTLLGADLENGYFDYQTANQNQENAMQAGLLPTGSYRICIRALHPDDEVVISVPGSGNECIEVEVSSFLPPRITGDEAGIGIQFIRENPVNVNWFFPSSFPYPTNIIVEARPLTFEEAMDFDREGRPHDIFDNMTTTISDVDVENVTSYTFENLPVAEHFSRTSGTVAYAVRVTASSSTGFFQQSGRSNIVIFVLNNSDCGNPNITVETVYPKSNDTIPTIIPFFDVRFDPLCDNIIRMQSQLQIVTRGSTSGANSNIYRYDNNWPNGPENFLQNFAQSHGLSGSVFLPTPELAQHLPFYLSDQAFQYIRGGQYSKNQMFQFQKRLYNGLRLTTTLQPMEFLIPYVVGMPKPRNLSPTNFHCVNPSSVVLEFKTGEPPSKLIPESALYILDGNRFVGTPSLGVQEKCVVQISKHPTDFTGTNLLFSEIRKVEGYPGDIAYINDWEAPNFAPSTNFRTHRDFSELAFRDQIYFTGIVFVPRLSLPTNQTKDTLYWRVAWLKNPDSYTTRSTIGTNIVDTDIYHSSSINSFVIDNSCSETVTDDDEVADDEDTNQPTDCERICNFTPPTNTDNIANITVNQIIHAGPYNIRASSITSSSTTGHTGEGVLEINQSGGIGPLYVQVRFDNIHVNSALQLVKGNITALTNTSRPPVSNRAEISAALSAIDGIRRFIEATQPTGSPLPLGVDIAGGSEIRIVCAMESLSINSSGARASFLAGVRLPAEIGIPALLLRADNICFNPEGAVPTGRFGLASDLNIVADRGWEFGIAGGTDRNRQTYIEFDCAGFKEFGFRGNVKFSREALVPENPINGSILTGETNKVQAVFGTVIVNNRPGVSGASSASSGSAPRSENFLIDLTFNHPFQIVGLDGVGFTVNTAVLDLSEVSNNPSMLFPEGYSFTPGGSTATVDTRLRNAWTGFYIRELSVRLPKDIDESRQGFGIYNLLIDGSGISVAARVSGGWAEAKDGNGFKLTLDNFEISVLQSRSLTFSLNGKIGLPIFENRLEDYMAYSAGLQFGTSASGSTEANLVFRITVPQQNADGSPHRGLKIPMWDIATIKLAPSTNVELKIGTNTQFSFGITGDVTFLSSDNPESQSKDITINLPHIEVQNLRFSTAVSGITGRIDLVNGSSRTNIWSQTGSGGSAPGGGSPGAESSSTASSGGSGSQQGQTAGFPINLRGIDIQPFGDIVNMEYDIRFDIQLSFSDQIEAGGNFGFRFDLGQNGQFNQFTIKEFLPPTQIDIAARNMGGLELEGKVAFCNSAGNERFYGALKVKVPSLCTIKLYADIGTQRNDPNAQFNTADNFSFFAIEGSVRLEQGLTIFSGIALYGLGGGVFYNMERTGMPGKPTPNRNPSGPSRERVPDDLPEPEKFACGQAPYRPLFNRVGFIFQAFLGDNGGGSAYNLDVSVGATFEMRGGAVVGIQSVDFRGDLYVACDIGVGNSSSAPLQATVAVSYNRNPDGDTYYEGIHGIIAVKLDLSPIIEGSGEGKKLVDAVFHVDNRDMWYFYLGAPKGIQDRQFAVDGRRSTMQNYPGPAGIKALGMTINSYFMIGKSIPDLPPIDAAIEQILVRASGFDEKFGSTSDVDAIREKRPTDMESGDGFAHGINFNMSQDFNFLLFYANLSIILGYDINFRKYEGRSCAQTDGSTLPLGINGWYAKGQAYAGLTGEFGIGIKIGDIKVGVKIVDLGCAIALEAAFPNPNWFKGRAGMYYDVMGHHDRAYFVFEIGSKCYDPNYTPLEGMKFISEIAPEGPASTMPKPIVSFVMPMDRELALEDLQYAGPENDRPVYRYFTPKFKGIEIMKVIDRTQVSVSPEKHYLEGKMAVRQYIDGPELSAHSKYKIKATVEVYERVGGEMVQLFMPSTGRPWLDTLTVEITTGDLATKLEEDNIVCTYPFKNQRNFMVGERGEKGVAGGGYIEFGQRQAIVETPGTYPNMLASTRTSVASISGSGSSSSGSVSISYELELAPSDNLNRAIGNRILSVNLTTNAFTFNIPPDLDRNQIYRARLKKIKTYTDPTGKSIFTSNKKIIQTISHSATIDGEKVTVTKNIAANSLNLEALDTESAPDKNVLYEFYFRTSKYNTLSDKFRSFTDKRVEKVWGQIVINYQADEPFDEFDKYGYISPRTNEKIFSGLVNFVEPYTNTTLNRVKNNIYKFTQDIENAAWSHTFTGLTGPRINESVIAAMNEYMFNTYRGYHPEIQFIAFNKRSANYLDASLNPVIYRVSKSWDPSQYPQQITLAEVATPLAGVEITYRRMSAAEELSREFSAPLYGSSRPGELTYYGSGSSARSTSITLLNMNNLTWSIHLANVKNSVGALLGKYDALMIQLAYQVSGTYRRDLAPGDMNYYFKRLRGESYLNATFLSLLKYEQLYNHQYADRENYYTDVYYNRPKAGKRKIEPILWRIGSEFTGSSGGSRGPE